MNKWKIEQRQTLKKTQTILSNSRFKKRNSKYKNRGRPLYKKRLIIRFKRKPKSQYKIMNKDKFSNNKQKTSKKKQRFKLKLNNNSKYLRVRTINQQQHYKINRINPKNNKLKICLAISSLEMKRRFKKTYASREKMTVKRLNNTFTNQKGNYNPLQQKIIY